MVYIETMYGSKTAGVHDQVRVPVAQAATLQQTDVLFMILSAETNPGQANRWINGVPYRRSREAWGSDNYAVLIDYDDGQGGLTDLLFGLNDRNFAWVRFNDPHKRYEIPASQWDPAWNAKINWPPWLPSGAVVFTGVNLSMADWGVAQQQFDADMH